MASAVEQALFREVARILVRASRGDGLRARNLSDHQLAWVREECGKVRAHDPSLLLYPPNRGYSSLRGFTRKLTILVPHLTERRERAEAVREMISPSWPLQLVLEVLDGWESEVPVAVWQSIARQLETEPLGQHTHRGTAKLLGVPLDTVETVWRFLDYQAWRHQRLIEIAADKLYLGGTAPDLAAEQKIGRDKAYELFKIARQAVEGRDDA